MEFQRGSATTFVPNGHSFNGRSIYDGVFSSQRKAVQSAIEDYGEIFGGSGSSIPVLEVPELNGSKIAVDVRSSKLDYSKIFGGFGDFDFAASHEELFLAKPKSENKSPAKIPPLSESSIPSNFPVANEVSSNEASHESFDGKKEVKVLYNRTSPGSTNGANGTTHVAQLQEVPGYSFVIDGMAEGDKPVSSALHVKCSTSNGKMRARQYRRTMSELPPAGACIQKCEGDREVRNKSLGIESHRNGVVSEACEVGVGKHPSKVRRTSSFPSNVDNSKCDSSKYGAAGLSSSPNLDEEVDANSVAATSAAAVTKAIEEAQASIKVALELMGRKKEGNMKMCFDGLKAKEKRESKKTVKEKKIRGKDARDKDAAFQTSFKRKQNASKPAHVVPDLGHIETLDSEAAAETHRKNFRSFQSDHRRGETEKRESEEQVEINNVMQPMNECGLEEKKTNENQKVETIEDALVIKAEQDIVNEVSELQDSRDKLKSTGEVRDQKEGRSKLLFTQIWEKVEEMIGVSTDVGACEGKLSKLEEDANQCMVDNEKKNEAVQQESCAESNDFPGTVESQTILLDSIKEEKYVNGRGDASETIKPEEEQEELCRLEENDEKNDVCIGNHAEKPSDEFGKTGTNEKGFNGFQYGEENENKHEEDEIAGGNQEESGNVVTEASKIKETEDIQEGTSEWELTRRMQEVSDQSVEGTKTGETEERQRGTPEWVNTQIIQEEIDQNVEAEKTGENEERQRGTSEWVGAHLLQEETDQSVESKKMGDNEEKERWTSECVNTLVEETDQIVEGEKTGENEERQKGTSEWVNTHVVQEMTYQSVEGEKTGDTEEVHKFHRDVSETAEDADEQVEINIPTENQECHSDEHYEGVDMNPELLGCDENVVIEEPTEACDGREPGAVEAANNVEYAGVFDASGLAESIFGLGEIKSQMEKVREAHGFDKNGMNVGVVDMKFEQLQHDRQAKDSDVFAEIKAEIEELVCEFQNYNQYFEVYRVAKGQENKDIPDSRDGIWRVDDGESIGVEQPPCAFEGKEETVEITHEENHCETLTEIEIEFKATSLKEMDLKKEEKRKRAEAKERKKEREMERKAVERAVLEARERAYAEAREKAERAAAERANAEARRRAMSEAQGKLEKPSAELNDKASMESKLKAERAAVERATAEARQRALEKVFSFKARNQSETFPSERSSGSSRDNGTKHNTRPYVSHSTVSDHPASSRHTSSSNNGATQTSESFDGANGESAQRCKARLERHQRTEERAANALAEKNMRDLLAQKEQAERNRLADTLDAEVKRWAKGKEGNLRALLSTLQYILGPESGWQPIPLTDLIVTPAVKKAYRKSTLYVHPDKLQQRGASIQQKYTCEKVFDLLKAAWNKFNSEER